MTDAVEIQDISKRFRLHQERYQSLKERILHVGRNRSQDFWALQDINISVEQGTTLGLLGHNGSGKSTLLKCIAGILQPTTGEIRTRGRIAALLELGAGFQSELTGRENIYLNGSILGMAKKEIERRFDAIVAFSELEPFIDTQVRFYSSGMYVRLGFAVAVNVDPDILLIDEVLAVGDEAFQRKCLDRVAQFQREGRTIIVVSHAPDLVRQVCNNAVVLDHGNMVFSGAPADAVRSFREHLLQGVAYQDVNQAAREVAPNRKAEITGLEIVYPDSERLHLLPDEPLVIRLTYKALEPIDDCEFGINIYDMDGSLLFGSNTAMAGIEVGRIDGEGEIRFSFDHIPLLDGDYPISVGITSRDGAKVYDWQEQRYKFSVLNPGKTFGIVVLQMKVEVIEDAKVST